MSQQTLDFKMLKGRRLKIHKFLTLAIFPSIGDHVYIEHNVYSMKRRMPDKDEEILKKSFALVGRSFKIDGAV